MSRARLAWLAAALLTAGSVHAGAEAKFKPGAKAPGFRCELLAGGEVSLTDLLAQGNVVVLSFFDTNCKPCMTEIPRLGKLIGGYAGKPVVAYLVSIGLEDNATVKKFVAEKGFTLPVIEDREGLRVGERYGVVEDQIAHVPQVVIISKNGIIKGMWAGFREGMEARVTGLLDGLITEAKAAPANDGVEILFTNNTNGTLGPSAMIDVGGLARRGTLLKRERAASPSTLLLEGGDFFPTSPDEAKTRQLIAAYKTMKYDAVGIGEAEFVNGLGFLRAQVSAKALPFVSANVMICKAEECVTFAKPQLLTAFGGHKVAVFSYMDPDAVGFTPEDRFKDGVWYVKFVDPRPLLKGWLEKNRKEAELVIVISHAGIEADRKLADEVPGIDLIVGAHSQTFMPDPTREGDTVIVQAASDGQYVGKIMAKFGEGPKPVLSGYELMPLTKNIADDPEVTAILGAGKAQAAAN